MRSQPSSTQEATIPARPERPSILETAQRWQETGGIEGVSLEWMLDRTRPIQEARP